MKRQYKNIPRVQYIKYKQKQCVAQMPKIIKPPYRQQGVALEGEIAEVFQNSFVFLMLGRPGSGKTSTLSQIITRPQFYGKKFGRILYITPSDIPGIEHDEKINTCRTIDYQWLARKFKQLNGVFKNVLLIVDDVIAEIPTNQKNAFKNIFYDRRHILGEGSCLSIIVTSQKFRCVPKWLRVCINMLMTFSVQPAQITQISRQLNTGKDIKMLNMLFRNLQKYAFIYVNLQKGQCFNSQFQRI